MSSKRDGSNPHSSLGRPATAFSPILGIWSPAYSQKHTPSLPCTIFGASSANRDGTRPLNMSGGSTVWSSTLISTRSRGSITDNILD
jgi:hypothetical protein